jgi:hypothetical protein
VNPVPPPAGASTGTPPAANAAPTKVLANTQTEANGGLSEALAGYANGQSAQEGSNFRGAGGVQTGALPGGIAFSQTIQCSLLASNGSGSVTISYDYPNGLADFTGGTVTYTYNQCSFSGITSNGTFRMTYSRFASAMDYTYTTTWTNFTTSFQGQSTTISGSQTCTATAGVARCDYSDSTGRTWTSGLTYSNATLNGSYTANYGGGVVTVKYTNFNATGGTAEITGANGTKIVITRNSATRYTVVITVNGQSTTYVFGS